MKIYIQHLCTAMLPVTERLEYRNIFRVHCEQLGGVQFSSGRSEGIRVWCKELIEPRAYNKKSKEPCQVNPPP